MAWIMEIKMGDEWKAIRPDTHKPPYYYADEVDAQNMIEICYPRMTDGEERRVRELDLPAGHSLQSWRSSRPKPKKS